VHRSHIFDPKIPPIGKRRCFVCGVPLSLARINPTDNPDHDERTFECSKCGYGETVVVKFRHHRIELI